MGKEITYELVAVIKSENCTSRVERPILTPDEYRLRFKMLEEATKALGKELYWPKQIVS